MNEHGQKLYAQLHEERRRAEGEGWDASAQSESGSSSTGSSGIDRSDSPPSPPDSPLPTLTRLATAMEVQNEALWALVHQTATLIALLTEGGGEEEESDDAPRYLDGSRVS